MPAEWAQHSAIWLSWPHDTKSFPPQNIEKAEALYAEFVQAISTSEPVELHVLDGAMRERAEHKIRERGTDMGKVRFHESVYGDVWIRDYGPIFIKNEAGELAIAKFVYNALGEKYQELLKDNFIPYEMNKLLKLPMYEADIILEGGSIDVNGKGTVLTTEQCLLNKNRNAHLSPSDLEAYLSEYLGAPHVIWLPEGIEGDDTDGHVDDVARFVDETTIVCAIEDNPNDANHAPLQKNYEILNNATDQDGRPFTVIPLPMPGRVTKEDGERLPASYANFYIGNTVVIMPVFGHENDAKAAEILAGIFPEKKIVPIEAYYLVYGYGTFHCASQQQPA